LNHRGKKRPIYLALTATGLTIRIVLSICTEGNPILFLIQTNISNTKPISKQV
jgi:hypothetical protein